MTLFYAAAVAKVVMMMVRSQIMPINAICIHHSKQTIFNLRLSQAQCLYTCSLLDHFEDISGSLVVEDQAIVRRASLATHLVNEQSDLLRMVLKRSSSSFQKLSTLIQQLCKNVLTLDRHNVLASKASQELQNERHEWSQLQKTISTRKSRLNSKSTRFKQGKIKRFNKNRVLEQQSRYLTQQQYKFPLTKSINGKNSEVKTILRRDEFDLEYKIKLRQQFNRIKEFIVSNLAPMLEYSQGREVPKKIVLNIYMAWNRQQQLQCLIEDTGKMQMELTNQLKICFPRMSMNRNAFQNIQFRSEFTQQLQLTDRLPSSKQHKSQFYVQDPVDQLLREANQLKAFDESNEKEEWLGDFDNDMLIGQ